MVAACSPPSITEKAGNPTLQAARPEEVGLSSDSLNNISPFLQEYIDSAYIAGGVVLISRDNKVIYNKAVGYFDREKTRSLKNDDIFRIASMTKPILTVAVMQLYEQGKIDVNDPVSMYIPSFKDHKVVENFNEKDSTYTTKAANKEITIHHLLTHTSGIAYGFFHPVAGPIYAPFNIIQTWTKDSISLSMNIPKMGKLPLLHEPGDQFTYGLNSDILGYIVEIVSGIPLDEYFAQNIIDPLGMKDTYFFLPEEKANRLVEVWFRGDFTPTTFPESFREDYPIKGFKTYFPGGGGLSGTAIDYLKFASMLLNKGTFDGVKILKPETVNLMMSNQIGDVHLEEGLVQFGYGASLYTNDGPFGRRKGRFSWGGFWQTNFWIDPDREMIVVVMTNAFDTPKFDPFFNGLEEIINNAVVDDVVQ